VSGVLVPAGPRIVMMLDVSLGAQKLVLTSLNAPPLIELSATQLWIRMVLRSCWLHSMALLITKVMAQCYPAMTKVTAQHNTHEEYQGRRTQQICGDHGHDRGEPYHNYGDIFNG
jgi:hypothetical protein